MTNHYPVWQTAIREALKTQQERNAEADATAANVQAFKDAQHGRDLARVLDVAFGIQLGTPPTQSRVELDGYSFWLKTETSSYDDHAPVFIEKPENGETKWISFTLYVNKVRPEDMSYSDWERWPRSRDFSVQKAFQNHDWTYLRAELANAIDELKYEADREIERFREFQKSGMTSKTAKPEAPTLEGLIRQIVRSELSKFEDGFITAMRGEF